LLDLQITEQKDGMGVTIDSFVNVWSVSGKPNEVASFQLDGFYWPS